MTNPHRLALSQVVAYLSVVAKGKRDTADLMPGAYLYRSEAETAERHAKYAADCLAEADAKAKPTPLSMAEQAAEAAGRG